MTAHLHGLRGLLAMGMDIEESIDKVMARRPTFEDGTPLQRHHVYSMLTLHSTHCRGCLVCPEFGQDEQTGRKLMS